MKTVNLDKVIADHQLWLESGHKQGKRANLCEADLQGARLHRANLFRANLFRANLQGADLSGAWLQEANLSGADLCEADLCEADLEGADLREAITPSSIRNCRSFRHAKFSPDALPWLILHPKWAEWKDTVQIVDC